MQKTKRLSKKDIDHLANLASLQIDSKEQKYFTDQFNETLEIINNLNKLSTDQVKETYHVTGLFNVTRKDIVDKSQMLSQEQALSNAKVSHKGYFVVKAIFDEQ